MVQKGLMEKYSQLSFCHCGQINRVYFWGLGYTTIPENNNRKIKMQKNYFVLLLVQMDKKC